MIYYLKFNIYIYIVWIYITLIFILKKKIFDFSSKKKKSRIFPNGHFWQILEKKKKIKKCIFFKNF